MYEYHSRYTGQLRYCFNSAAVIVLVRQISFMKRRSSNLVFQDQTFLFLSRLNQMSSNVSKGARWSIRPRDSDCSTISFGAIVLPKVCTNFFTLYTYYNLQIQTFMRAVLLDYCQVLILVIILDLCQEKFWQLENSPSKFIPHKTKLSVKHFQETLSLHSTYGLYQLCLSKVLI